MAGRAAIGVLEVRGMATLTGAVDAMLKAADVRLCGRHGIGSGWVTAVITGDVAAVETAVRVGTATAESHGQVITSQVIARPSQALELMPHTAASLAGEMGDRALGMIETQGLTPLVEGADAAVKAAHVDIAGWAFIGGALCHVVLRGDVAATQAAVAAGAAAAEEAGSIHATLVLPQPIDGVAALLPPLPGTQAEPTGALGLVETTGYVGTVAAADSMIKTADVGIDRFCIGSGGRSVVLVRGALDDVRAAVRRAEAGAEQVGELNAARVLTRPDLQTLACFAGAAGGEGAGSGQAMGLIETRTTVGLVTAVDAMLKAADVTYEGRYKVGYFLTAAVVRGDVGAVRAALDVGAEEAARHGELVAVHLIPYPYPELAERLIHR